MNTWIQQTFVNGKHKYRDIILSEEEMIERFAQIIFLKQAGEEIQFDWANKNEDYKTTTYMVTRKVNNRDVVTFFTLK